MARTVNEAFLHYNAVTNGMLMSIEDIKYKIEHRDELGLSDIQLAKAKSSLKKINEDFDAAERQFERAAVLAQKLRIRAGDNSTVNGGLAEIIDAVAAVLP
jgi:hypothetical protein